MNGRPWARARAFLARGATIRGAPRVHPTARLRALAALLALLTAMSAQAAPPPGNEADLGMALTREKPGDRVRIRLDLSLDGAPLSGYAEDFAVTSTRGVIESGVGIPNTVIEVDDGIYEVFLRPESENKTGEYAITATVEPPKVRGKAPFGAASAAKTALILAHVHPEFDQPQKVEGFVNTAGHEDSVHVTPDGQYLFAFSSPVSISCEFGNYAECYVARGSWTSPERPDFEGAERISHRGTVSYECVGLSGSPSGTIPDGCTPNAGPGPNCTVVPPIPKPVGIWGFQRQPGGAYAAPFFVGFENSGGCLAAGPPVVYPTGDGSADILFPHCDFLNPSGQCQWEFFADRIVLGQRNILGTWVGPDWPGHLEGVQSQMMVIPHADDALGVNLFAYSAGGTDLDSIVFDREQGANPSDLYLIRLDPDADPPAVFPQGPWTPPELLPLPLSTEQDDERMPYYDVGVAGGADQLIVFRNGEIALSRKNLDGTWSPYETVLRGDPVSTFGAIPVLGEPTLTDPALEPDGKEILFFVYGINEPDGTLNVEVGFVERN